MNKKKILMFKGTRPLILKLVGEAAFEKVIQEIDIRYQELLEENKDEPKALDPHTKARIYPAIAIFDTLLKHGVSRDDAAKVIYDFFDIYALKGAKTLQTILKIPGLYKKVPSFALKMVNKSFGANAGFKAHVACNEKDHMHIDMLVCPYNEICRKYGCPEIVKAFCHSDDVAYGHMHPKLSWERSGTLGRGDDVCDFIIKVKK